MRALRTVVQVRDEPYPERIRRAGSDPANILHLGDERTSTARHLQSQDLAVHDITPHFPQSTAKGRTVSPTRLEEVADQLPALSTEPADQADCSLVLPALAKVDEVYQAAVALFYLEDCSYKDIAEILDVPIGTVKSRIARGIAQLREILLSNSSHASTPSKRIRLVGL